MLADSSDTFLLGKWKKDPAQIPGVVELDRNGETVGGEELAEWQTTMSMLVVRR
jgi:hypothetical protein